MRRLTLVASVAAIFMLPAATISLAQNETGGNYLQGHRFSPSLLLLNPFATSQVTVGFMLGYSNPEIPRLSANPDLKLAVFVPRVEGQIRFFEAPLTFSFQALGVAVAGLNTASSQLYGASTAYSLGFGPLYQFYTSTSTVLSAGINVRKPRSFARSPLISGGAEFPETIQSGESDLSLISDRTEWMPTLRYAQAITPSLGLQANLGAKFFSGGSDTDPLQGARGVLAVGADYQLRPELNFPAAVSLIYQRDQILTNGIASNANSFCAGLFETFSPRFNFGGEFTWLNSAPGNAYLLSFLARYYY